MVSTRKAASDICTSLGRGVTRSKRRAQEWLRKAAENGKVKACAKLALRMYMDLPYARQVGHVGEAAGVAMSAGVAEGHYVPPDVLADIGHWLRKGGHNLVEHLNSFRIGLSEGGMFCQNQSCEVVGQLKEFKVCPQCKTARYCSDVCQKQDWTSGGHKAKCGTSAY